MTAEAATAIPTVLSAFLAQAHASQSVIHKRTITIGDKEYKQFYVKEGKEIPKEAVQIDGIYWIPKNFSFRKSAPAVEQPAGAEQKA